jgi:hypothetical protein
MNLVSYRLAKTPRAYPSVQSIVYQGAHSSYLTISTEIAYAGTILTLLVNYFLRLLDSTVATCNTPEILLF